MVVSVTIPYHNHIFKCNGEIAKNNIRGISNIKSGKFSDDCQLFRKIRTKLDQRPNFLLHQLITVSTNYHHNDSSSYLDYQTSITTIHKPVIMTR